MPAQHEPVQFRADDVEELEWLYEELRATPGLVVRAVSGPVVPGEQGGVLEFLTVALASGGGLTALVRLLTTLARSRAPKFSLKVSRGADRVELTGDNLAEALPIIKELLGGS